MDINRALKMAVNTGKVLFGINQAVKTAESGNVKLFIRASNFPEEQDGQFSGFDTPSYTYSGNNYELGAVCGKPFSIAIISVIDPGESDILDLARSEE